MMTKKTEVRLIRKQHRIGKMTEVWVIRKEYMMAKKTGWGNQNMNDI